ncbi:hypothetical protein INR49_015375, partial [Caranx melampygus]
SVNTDMLRHFRQIRTQTTRGKENSEIRSSAVTTIGPHIMSWRRTGELALKFQNTSPLNQRTQSSAHMHALL